MFFATTTKAYLPFFNPDRRSPPDAVVVMSATVEPLLEIMIWKDDTLAFFGGVQRKMTWLLDRVAVTFVGAPGTTVSTVEGFAFEYVAVIFSGMMEVEELEKSLTPRPFIAATLKVCVEPDWSPPIVWMVSASTTTVFTNAPPR